MRKQLLIIIGICAIALSCTKKGNVQPTPAGFVNIGGALYPTVVIGTQTWTSVNYNGPGGINFNNSTANDPVAGKLYTYTEAEAIAVPAGWHLPTRSDFATLLLKMGTTDGSPIYSLPDTSSIKLMAKTTWLDNIGTNSSGFNAVATGIFSSGNFRNLNNMTNILTTSQFPNGGNMSLQIYEEYATQIFIGMNAVIPYATDRGSVRFVKNN
jgi:uncharacterized protein (TIGR02145 family)